MTSLLAALLVATAPLPEANIKAAAKYSADHAGFSFYLLENGKLRHEEYPNGGRADRATELASGTKSFSGIMAVCAQQDGLLTLDEKVSKTITEWQADDRRDITIRQLLTLSSGIPGGQSALNGGRVPSYAEAIRATARFKPGVRFSYGPTPYMIFGEVMRRKLAPKSESVLDYMNRRIFKPIGLSYGFWRKDKDGNAHLPSGAALTAKEWAKFGEMVRLGGQNVVKADLLKECFRATGPNKGYGLTWWLPGQGAVGASARIRRELDEGLPKDIYQAAGAGGQRLIIIPSRGITVIRQAPVRNEDRTFNDMAFIRILLTGK